MNGIKQPVFIRRSSYVAPEDMPDKDYFGYNMKLRDRARRPFVRTFYIVLAFLTMVAVWLILGSGY